MWTLIGRALRLRCPSCGGCGPIRRWFGVRERCPSCALWTGRSEGHWVGALGLNVILSFTGLFAALLLGVLASWPAAPGLPLAVVAVAIAVGAPVLLLPFSRVLWLAIDLRLHGHRALSDGHAGTPARPARRCDGDDRLVQTGAFEQRRAADKDWRRYRSRADAEVAECGSN